MCFMDLEKTYDCVFQHMLWEVLQKYGICRLVLCEICSVYEHSESECFLGVKLKPFKVGV